MIRRLLLSLALASLVLAGCGDDDDDEVVSATTTTSTTVEEGEGRDPDAKMPDEVCTGISDAWQAGDETAASDFFSDPAGVEQLFEVAYDEATYVETEFTGDGCILHAGDVDGVVEMYGDGHVGWSAAGVTWAPVGDGDGSDDQALLDAVIAYRSSPEACGGMAAELPEGVSGYDRDGVLVLITCEMFAYQATYEPMAWDDETLTPLPVEQWREGALTEESVILGNPVLAGTQLLNLEKARGPGDCGLYQVWDVSTAGLELLEARERACDDAAPGDPADPSTWTLVYES